VTDASGSGPEGPVEAAGAGDPLAGDPLAVDTYDRLRRRVMWKLPSGLYLLGTTAGAHRNLMTLNWASQVALQPKLVGVSVEREAFSAGLVADGGVFALSIGPSSAAS
jgi:flavin reductase (DIM6/NTAB) family NADH-FMN oxidoreductase RutF